MDRNNIPLTAPLLDRLLGHNKGVDLTRGYNLVRSIKESIRRDLENLFNTRYCRISPPRESTHLQSSVLNFGLPDLSAINMTRSEEHTSELQSRPHLVCRLLLEKKKKKQQK